eukprot:jgi/Bigna1/78923/fgenesh1_pg.58_\
MTRSLFSNSPQIFPGFYSKHSFPRPLPISNILVVFVLFGYFLDFALQALEIERFFLLAGISDLRTTNTNVEGGGEKAQEDDDENEMYKQMKAILEADVASGAITAGEKDVILSKLAKSQDEGMQMEIEDIPSYMYLPRCLITDKIKDGYFSEIIGSGSYEDADVTPNAAVLMIDSLYKQVKELSLEISQMNAEFHSFLVKNEGASEVATEHLSNRISVLAGYMEECDEVLVSKTKPSVLSRSGSSMNSNEAASASPHSGSLGRNNNTSTKATTEEYGWISKPARSAKPTVNASPSRKVKESAHTRRMYPDRLRFPPALAAQFIEGESESPASKNTEQRHGEIPTQRPKPLAIEKGNPEECKSAFTMKICSLTISLSQTLDSSGDLRAKLLLPMASEGPRRLRLRERKIGTNFIHFELDLEWSSSGVGSNVTNSLESISDDGEKDAKVRKNGKSTSMASDVGTEKYGKKKK